MKHINYYQLDENDLKAAISLMFFNQGIKYGGISIVFTTKDGIKFKVPISAEVTLHDAEPDPPID